MMKVLNERKHPYLVLQQWYDFIFRNIIYLPDGSSSMVLVDSKGKKYLVPYKMYSHYGLVNGQIISCKVDKINCTGKVFLEPKHPFYNEGEIYTFHKNDIQSVEKEDGSNVNRVFLNDNMQNIFEFDLPEGYNPYDVPEKLKCRVSLCRKAKVYLNWIEIENEPESIFIKGKIYDFTVIECGHLFENELFIILKGIDEKLHAIKKKHYSEYGMKAGEHIFAEYMGRDEKQGLIFEPLHPVYKTGGIYEFSYFLELKDKEQHLFLNDIFNNQIDMGVTSIDTLISDMGIIKAKILELKRGIPVLQLV